MKLMIPLVVELSRFRKQSLNAVRFSVVLLKPFLILILVWLPNVASHSIC